MYPSLFPPVFPQALSPTLKAHIETLLTFYTDMSQRTLEAMQRLAEVNMQFGREFIAEIGSSSQRLMASKDASQLGAAVANQLSPGNEAIRAYQKRLADVISGTNAAMAQTAATHVPHVSRSATNLAADVMRTATEETARVRERQQHAMQSMGVPNLYMQTPASQFKH